MTLNNILSHESIEAPTVLQEKMRGVQSVIQSDSVFAYTLRPYQIDGVKMDAEFKAMDIRMRVLADEMGLGKQSKYKIHRRMKFKMLIKTNINRCS